MDDEDRRLIDLIGTGSQVRLGMRFRLCHEKPAPDAAPGGGAVATNETRWIVVCITRWSRGSRITISGWKIWKPASKGAEF